MSYSCNLHRVHPLTSTSSDTTSSRRSVCFILTCPVSLLNLYSLAIVGGLILLVNMGPGTLAVCSCDSLLSDLAIGGLSVDEKKKTY